MIKIIPAFAVSLTLLCGCNNNDKTAKTEEKTETKSEAKKTTNDDDVNKVALLSGITVMENGGLKVTRAFVSTEEGNVFSGEVTAGTDEKLILNLNLDGFKVQDGKSFVGASEKITAADGSVILDADDLFSAYTSSGINADDAHVIRLSAVVTGDINKNAFYTVSFKVWDKKGDGQVTGSYKIMPK